MIFCASKCCLTSKLTNSVSILYPCIYIQNVMVHLDHSVYVLTTSTTLFQCRVASDANNIVYFYVLLIYVNFFNLYFKSFPQKDNICVLFMVKKMYVILLL